MLDYTVENQIATITFNRPEKLNAFSRDLAEQFITLLDRADADDHVRVVVITGAGKAFCAGKDLSGGDKSFQGSDSSPHNEQTFDYKNLEFRDFGGVLTLRLYSNLKPVIAAINGAAVGVGATMILPMDIRLASTHAKFGYVFARRGIVPESNSSWFLPRVVGIGKAMEWMLSGRMVSAEEALDAGLVHSVHEPEDLLPEAYRLAREIADNNAPVSVSLTRQMMWQMLGADHPMDAHRIESWGIYSRARSRDVVEGINSFLEKRSPVFSDKVSTDMPGFFPWFDDPEY